jgi:hypothetical protein
LPEILRDGYSCRTASEESAQMKGSKGRSKVSASLRVKTAIKGGRLAQNHNARTSLRVKTAIKGGRLAQNHTRRAI